jgi:hypothetical protein
MTQFPKLYINFLFQVSCFGDRDLVRISDFVLRISLKKGVTHVYRKSSFF